MTYLTERTYSRSLILPPEPLRRLLADPEPVRDRLRRGHQVHAAAARRNRALLRAFARDHGWGEPAWAA